jgi:putative salt-induced outer membrane protein
MNQKVFCRNQWGSLMLALSMMILILPRAYAEEDQNESPWTGTGELGIVLSRGNSDTETINANAQIQYSPEQWEHDLTVEWLQARDNGENTAKRFNAAFNSRYQFQDNAYAFAALRYDDDEFSGFNYQSSISLGYGRFLVNNERHVLKVEAGPGLRLSEPVNTGDTESELIARGVLDYAWKLSKNADISNVFLVETGENNTFFENKLALTTGITDALRLKLGLSVRRNSNVPADREKTDYLTTANLVYQFL